MSIIQTLTEGIVNRDLKKEGHALLSKWEATGLLEGLDTQQSRHNMARLLENQAKELLRESNAMSNGQVEGFATVAFPIVRRVFAGLIANDLVSVQPMSLPSGLIFFLDFVYSPRNDVSKSIYGTNQVGSQVTGGGDLVGSLGENIGGLRQQVGYAYASMTGSVSVAYNGSGVSVAALGLVSSMTEANKKLIKFDPDVLNETSSYVYEFTIPSSNFASASFDNLSAFNISGSGIGHADSSNSMDDDNTKLIRRLTSKSGTDLKFYAISNETSYALGQNELHFTFPQLDHVNVSSDATLGVIDTFNYPFEGNDQMPEIDIKVDSIAITAATKKLKAKWTPELGQDLNAYHNLDAEVELTSILSEQIALEIDRELLADLVNGATAATYYWSRSPGLFVNRATGEELGATAAAPDFTGTVSEWYETLIETINDVSAQIHLKTLRGGANYIVCSPEVANILEFTSGYRANVTADADKGTIGAVKVGSLSRKFDIIVDPYFPRNAILVGRKGGSFLESGYVYAPYVPLQTTPTIFGVEDFVPRKGVMTRYGKKMVRPDMYGLVIVRGLLGESGAS